MGRYDYSTSASSRAYPSSSSRPGGVTKSALKTNSRYGSDFASVSPRDAFSKGPFPYLQSSSRTKSRQGYQTGQQAYQQQQQYGQDQYGWQQQQQYFSPSEAYHQQGGNQFVDDGFYGQQQQQTQQQQQHHFQQQQQQHPQYYSQDYGAGQMWSPGNFNQGGFNSNPRRSATGFQRDYTGKPYSIL